MKSRQVIKHSHEEEKKTFFEKQSWQVVMKHPHEEEKNIFLAIKASGDETT